VARSLLFHASQRGPRVKRGCSGVRGAGVAAPQRLAAAQGTAAASTRSATSSSACSAAWGLTMLRHTLRLHRLHLPGQHLIRRKRDRVFVSPSPS
jgi:hypothetical protein